MRGKITKRSVDALSVGPRDMFLWDMELRGFGYKLTPRGRGYFVVSYQAPGRYRVTRRYVLGQYGTMTPDEARKAARDVLADVTKGNDPVDEKRAQTRAQRDETTSRLFDAYLRDKRALFRPHTMRYYQSLATKYILPRLGPLPVATVRREALVQIHRELSEIPVTANRVIQLIGMFYVWLTNERGLDVANPAYRFKRYPEHARETFLDADEMGRIGDALRTAEAVGLPPAPERAQPAGQKRARNTGMFVSQLVPANPVAVAMLRFLALTGWRKNEARTLKWSDLNLETGVVTLAHTKTGTSHRSLGGAALALVADQPRQVGSLYVFPGTILGQPLGGVERLWYAVRHAAGLSHVRLHDLRHSSISMGVSQGFSLYMVGKIHGHRTTRSTERYAHQQPDAMRVVADAVSSAINAAMNKTGTPVIPLRAAK